MGWYNGRMESTIHEMMITASQDIEPEISWDDIFDKIVGPWSQKKKGLWPPFYFVNKTSKN